MAKFEPGKSGNPGGRPKGKSPQALLRDALKVAARENGDTDFFLHMARLAYVNPDIAKAVFDRVCPKATGAELAMEGGGAGVITIRWAATKDGDE